MAGRGTWDFLTRHKSTILSPVPAALLYAGAYYPCLTREHPIVGQIAYALCAAAIACLFHNWSWILSTPYVPVQLFYGGNSASRFFGTVLLQYLAPVGLFAALIARYLATLQYDLNTCMLLVYYSCVSFALPFSVLFAYRILRAKRRFEQGQDLQHLTRDVWIVYSRPEGMPDEEDSLAEQKAHELADHPVFEGKNIFRFRPPPRQISKKKKIEKRKKQPFWSSVRNASDFKNFKYQTQQKGFYVEVVSLDDVNPEAMINGGALVLLFVLNPYDCQPDLSNGFVSWLRDEADLR